MGFLSNAITEFIVAQGIERTYWVAYSGGVDSHVLLHLLSQARHSYPLKLRAVYVNHGISPKADVWAKQCKTVCETWKVDFIQRDLATFQQKSASLENLLRQARYQIFAECLSAQDILLTAHQQNDQAETVLLQLLRGAGVKGLAAMPLLKRFARGWHARPLLNFTRAALVEYAKQHQLQWIEDESNANSCFTRNFLRHEILPTLAQRWPTVTHTLARVAKNCAQTQDVLTQLVQQELAAVRGTLPQTLSVKKLLLQSPALQCQLLRMWLSEANFLLPSTVKLQQVLTTVLQARPDKMPQVTWTGGEIRRYRDDIFCLLPLAEHDASQIIPWQNVTPLAIKNIGIVNALPLRTQSKNITVRFRQGGEKFQLPGRSQQHALKKIFQDLGVPPWLRARIPLIYVDETLAVIAGFFVADKFLVEAKEIGMLLVQQRQNLLCHPALKMLRDDMAPAEH